jgi:integrase
MRTKIRRKQTRSGVRWYLSVIDGAGREHYHGGYGTRKEATARAAELVTDARRGRYSPPGRVTVADYLDEWLDGRDAADISPGTRDLERLIVRVHIVPHVGNVPLQELGTADLRRLYATLRERGGKGGRPLRGKTVANVHGLLSKALGDATRQEPHPPITVNPVSSVDPPSRDDSSEQQAWTREEVRRFLAVATEDRLGAIWRLALATGLRRGELLGMWWSDVDGEAVAIRRQILVRVEASPTERRIYVRPTTKTRRVRRVRFDDATAVALAKWKVTQDRDRLRFGPAWKTDGDVGVEGPWVVTEPDGQVIRPATLHQRWRAVARRAAVPEIPLHGARHSYATLALGAGVRLDVVSRQLGHSSIATTADIYTHDDEEAAQEAAAKVASVILPEGRRKA